MFDWLEKEMQSVRTPHFFEVDGPASPELREAVELSDAPLPPSYRQFVLQFGNAKLYRYSSDYYVTIFAGPRGATDSKGESYVLVGRTWTSRAYFKESLLQEGRDSPVFERYYNSTRKTADGFEEWLHAKCRMARKRFKKGQWQAVVEGPAPFTEQEAAIARARKKFTWRVVGIASDGELEFEVHNASELRLPYLSVGIRYKNGEDFGGVSIPVSHVAPGQTVMVKLDCYKATHDPSTIEAFELPDAEPALRDLYWEFRECQS
jgi:hypothetical protein